VCEIKSWCIMIAIGSDHAGFDLKLDLVVSLQKKINIKDLGTYSRDACDYPEFAKRVVKSILTRESQVGILICGTGIGMSIVANRFKNIRAALCHDVFSAKMAREHNNANVLVLGARVINKNIAHEILKVFLESKFTHELKHIERINQIDN